MTTQLSRAVETTRDAQDLFAAERHQLARATMQTLSKEDQREVLTAALSPPTRTTNKIWPVTALVIAPLVSLGAVIFLAMTNDEVSAGVLPAVLTSVPGYLVGLIHPSPVSGD